MYQAHKYLLLSVGLVVILVQCKKESFGLPNNAPEMILGNWDLDQVRTKSYRGNVRVGGQRLTVYNELIMDSTRYEILDDLGDVVIFGQYTMSEDSVIFWDSTDLNAAPTRFQIQKLTKDELWLLETQFTDTRLGEMRSEGVYRYER